MSAPIFAAGLITIAQNVATHDEIVGAPSPTRSGEWACELQTANDEPIEVDVAYDGSNRQVSVEIPSLRHSFAREAHFDDRFMMWTEDPQVGHSVLWTIVRGTLEIRLTRIIGSTVRVNSGRCELRQNEVRPQS